jgi:hypothetical protein
MEDDELDAELYGNENNQKDLSTNQRSLEDDDENDDDSESVYCYLYRTLKLS